MRWKKLLTLLLLIILVPLVLVIVFSLIAGVVGVAFGLLKFIVPVIIIAAVVNWLFNRGRHHDRQQHYYYHSSYQPPHQSGPRVRKELHDVHEHTEKHDDEWSDF